LAEAVAGLTYYPQTQVGVRLSERRDVSEVPEVAEAIRAVETELDGAGRVVVRNSGTEPKVRIMVEGRDEARTQELAEGIAEVVRAEMGAAEA
ncbi:MAG: phosphoglucosamine mutase, partial [Thiohalorhabdaceae bacterium]